MKSTKADSEVVQTEASDVYRNPTESISIHKEKASVASYTTVVLDALFGMLLCQHERSSYPNLTRVWGTPRIHVSTEAFG